MQAITSALSDKGYLLMSGFYTEENQLLIDAATVHGLQLIKASDRHTWSSLLFQKIS